MEGDKYRSVLDIRGREMVCAKSGSVTACKVVGWFESCLKSSGRAFASLLQFTNELFLPGMVHKLWLLWNLHSHRERGKMTIKKKSDGSDKCYEKEEEEGIESTRAEGGNLYMEWLKESSLKRQYLNRVLKEVDRS